MGGASASERKIMAKVTGRRRRGDPKPMKTRIGIVTGLAKGRQKSTEVDFLKGMMGSVARAKRAITDKAIQDSIDATEPASRRRMGDHNSE
jgi:hypothetical protein